MYAQLLLIRLTCAASLDFCAEQRVQRRFDTLKQAEHAVHLTQMASQDCPSYYASVAKEHAERWAAIKACPVAHDEKKIADQLQYINTHKKPVCRLRSLSNNSQLVCAAFARTNLKMMHLMEGIVDRLRAENYTLDIIFAPIEPHHSKKFKEPYYAEGILPIVDKLAMHISESRMLIHSFRCPSHQGLRDAVRCDVKENDVKVFSAVRLLNNQGQTRTCRVCSLLGLLSFASHNVEFRAGDRPEQCAAALHCVAARILARKGAALACKDVKMQRNCKTKFGMIEPLCDPQRTPSLRAKLSNASWMKETIANVCRPLRKEAFEHMLSDYRLVLETPGDQPYSAPAVLEGMNIGAVIVQTSISAAYIQPGLSGIRSGFFRLTSECDFRALVDAISTNLSVFADLGKANRALSHQCWKVAATKTTPPGKCDAEIDLGVAVLKAFALAQGRCTYSHAVNVFDQVKANGTIIFQYSAR